MHRRHPTKPMTRRTALRRIAGGSIGAAALSNGAWAKQTSRPTTAIRIETQPTGSEIWQVTTEEYNQSNIYCEVPYCSSDSRYFIYERTNPKLPGRNNVEFMVVELGTWKQHRLDTSIGLVGSAITHDGVFYYLKRVGARDHDLMRVDLGKGTPQRIYRFEDEARPRSLGTVSADGRYYATGKRLGDDHKMFGILLIDLKTGTKTIADQDPFILNPHPQFSPGQAGTLMIQHNRGGTYTPDGKLERLVGPEGATLYLLSISDGKRTALQVGKPFTTPVTGHEAWIGKTGEILLSVAPAGDYAIEKGNMLCVRPGEPARRVAGGHYFNHVGVSRCGRFFSADDYRETYKIVIGSIATGKTGVVCESLTKPTRAQNTHPHPYLTPDLKWVIYNSNRSGFAHVYAASVPDRLGFA
ncbi:MAG: hypothetical protein JXQ73_25315 [Phycisphaerae bacterium]|nr:hypothetical protein [Phycisphaerae bacterium]